jgi:two-component sensor histidine kinase
MSACCRPSAHACKRGVIRGETAVTAMSLRHTLPIMLAHTTTQPALLAQAGSSTPLGSKLARHGLIAIVFNAGIAAALSIAGKDPLAHNMVYSQLIGLSIWLLIDGGRHLLHPQGLISAKVAAVMTLTGGLLGYFFGSVMGDLVLGHPVLSGWRNAPNAMVAYLLMSLFAATLGVYFFMSRELLRAERAFAEQARQQATQAQLKLLQSQLDPHMLFNTLANLRVLIQQDPDRAVQMLDQLNDFLRSTLAASRASEHSLQAEFDRLRDYLALMQIRMGARLSFQLDLPPELAQIQVPALILQSLVENAVLHGLEPKVEGGRIAIRASQEAQQLVLQVADDGLGFDAAQRQEGFGLTQVRERLQSCYGDQATIKFIANYPYMAGGEGLKSLQKSSSATGCTVRLQIPLQR